MDPGLTHTSTVPSCSLASSQEPHLGWWIAWLLDWVTLARPYLPGPRFYHLRERGPDEMTP